MTWTQEGVKGSGLPDRHADARPCLVSVMSLLYETETSEEGGKQ